MQQRSFKPGDIVAPAFRPDNVGIVNRVYHDGEDFVIDVVRPGLQPFIGFPANVYNLVPESATLYGVGLSEQGVIVYTATAAGIDGLEMWVNHHPNDVAQAHVCRLDTIRTYALDASATQFMQVTPWHAVAQLLAEA